MHRNQGFTLFELLIILALLVVIAGVTVPQYFTTSAETQEQALVTDLEAVRGAIEKYREEHGGNWPGTHAAVASETTFVRHLTRRSDERGNPDGSGACGPYLSAGIPPNPFNGMDSVRVVSEGELPQPDGMTGWIYHAKSGEFKANAIEVAANGKAVAAF